MTQKSKLQAMEIKSWQPLSQLAKIRERVAQISQRSGWSPAADWFEVLLMLK